MTSSELWKSNCLQVKEIYHEKFASLVVFQHMWNPNHFSFGFHYQKKKKEKKKS